jgi:hypothetical protein
MLSILPVPFLVLSTLHPLYSLFVHPYLVYGSLLRLSCGLLFSDRSFSRFPMGDMGADFNECRAQFVGGDTAYECLPSIRRLRAENKGALLTYSVEADTNEITGGAHPSGETLRQHILQEMLRSIEVAADFEDSYARENPSSGRTTWVAVKLVSFIHCSYLNI